MVVNQSVNLSNSISSSLMTTNKKRVIAKSIMVSEIVSLIRSPKFHSNMKMHLLISQIKDKKAKILINLVEMFSTIISNKRKVHLCS